MLVSGDKAVGKALEALPAPRPSHRPQLSRTAHEVFRSAPTFEQATVRACLRLLAEAGPDLSLGDLGGEVTSLLYDDAQEVANQEGTAENLQVVGLDDLYLDRSERFVTGTLHVLADVTVTGVVQDVWGDSIVMRQEEAYGTALNVLVTFELDGPSGKSVIVDRGSGDATLPLEAEHLHPPAALRRVLDLLRRLPLAEDVPQDGWPVGQDVASITVLGTEVALRLDGDPTGAWTVTAELDGERVGAVSCHRYVSSSGPEDFVLTAEAASTHALFNPFWALNAAVLSTLVPDLAYA